MVICFNCSPQTKETLDGLVAAGGYRDISEAISAAIENLAVIHSEMKGRNAFVVHDNTVDHNESVRASETTPESETRLDPAFMQYAKTRTVRQNLEKTSRQHSVPLLFRIPAVPEKLPRLAALETAVRPPSATIPIENWIFGQFNRLLPVKATCRALANLTAGEDHEPLTEIANTIAHEAVKLGKYLSDIDESRNASRDDLVAVAFPLLTPRDSKAIERFENQFVGAINKTGKISGLPAELKLIGIDPEHQDGVLLTEAGLKFALLENPLLNGVQAEKPWDKFTPAEIECLLEHIVKHVPAEAFAYRTILNMVASGASTPSKLDDALLKVSKPESKSSFLSTQRSGAISRMTDLNLILRTREATRVSYSVTSQGQAFLSSKKI